MLAARKLVSGFAALIMAVSGALPSATAIVGRDDSCTLDDSRVLRQQSFELCPDEDEPDKIVTLDGLMPKNAAAEAVDVTEMIAEQDIVSSPIYDDSSVVVAYDITISDGSGEFQPDSSRPICVEIYDPSITDSANTELWHISDDGNREQISGFDVEDGKVSFYAEGFSVYAIVNNEFNIIDGVEGWNKVKNSDEFERHRTDGYYISWFKAPRFARDSYVEKLKKTDKRTGLAVTLAITDNSGNGFSNDTDYDELFENAVSAGAVKYYFEPTEDDPEKYYVYCQKGNAALYVASHDNTGSYNSLKLVDKKEDASVYSVGIAADGKTKIQYPEKTYWTYANYGTESQNGIGAFSTDDNNNLYLWYYNPPTPDDPYELDGKTYALVKYASGDIYGKALDIDNSTSAIKVTDTATKVNPLTHSGVNLIAENAQIAMWTFHNCQKDVYTLSAEVGGATKYLNISDSGVTLSSEPCEIKVTPDKNGNILLSAGGKQIKYSIDGKKVESFNVADSDGTYFVFAELSPLIGDDFQVYSAEKIGVSEVENGDSFIIYTRVWDDAEKSYKFYAVDHDGSLVPCYERGDNIMWIGSRINTLVWDFTEYYGFDGLPNNYYELYNPYSGKYLAPQIKGQVLSDSTIGLNLPGRRDGEYYTDILAWDDPHYAYAALKDDVSGDGNGQLASCSRRDAQSFYFAVIKKESSGLTEVETIDNDEFGITMKMVDWKAKAVQDNFLKSTASDNYKPTTGLLSTNLEKDENNNYTYPTAVKNDNKSLSELYGYTDSSKVLQPLTEVNHLFIKSTYEATGYFEFDSCQNFATLKNPDGTFNVKTVDLGDGNSKQVTDFNVYKELGTNERNYSTSKHGQFLPYNIISKDRTSECNPYNLYSALAVFKEDSKGMLPESDPRKYETLYTVGSENGDTDYYNGMELEAGFVQTPNGKDNWGHDIIFEFTGDDDFWLYVDGELVIDLGGIHSALSGNVNFATGAVMVNGKLNTLYDLFYSNYKGRGHTDAEAQAYVDDLFTQNEKGDYVFKDYSKHTMKIFYMERGAGASNLHMRFNLSYVTPGHVLLKKEIKNAGDLDLSLVQYPYQIYYKEKDDPNEYLLANTDRNVNVTYQNSTQKVEFKPSYTPPGCSEAIENVYFLNPEQVAEIHFPSDTMEYRIVECGISAGYDGVYKSVKIKDDAEALTGTEISGAGSVVKRYSYDSGWRSVATHTSTVFVNEINEKALRPLFITKKLYDESGNELNYDESANGTTGGNSYNDNTLFQFRLYLTNGVDDELRLANMAKYRVKNASGYYCKWEVYDPQPEDPSAPKGHFVSTGKEHFSDLSAEEKESATFETSINGTIAQIPAGYTIEVPNLTAGVRFKVVERPNETELGYGKVRYEREEGTYIKNESENDGTVFKDVQPIMRVINKRGYGLEVAKKWSDSDFVYDHDPIYVAVYEKGSDEPLELDGKTTVREISPQNSKVRYFFDGITDSVFDDYSVYEVELKPKDGQTEIKHDDDYMITNIEHFDVVKVEDGVLNNARRMHKPGVYDPEGEDKDKEQFSYFPTTIKGEAVKVNDQATGKKRTDTVKNTRKGGVIISLHDMADGTALSGGEFTIKTDSGDDVGTFTADSDGQITILFKEDNLDLSKTYTITQTKAPKGYIGVPEPVKVSFNVEGDSVTAVNITGNDSKWANGDIKNNDEENLIGFVKLYNKKTVFTVKKVDSITGQPVKGAHFALYKCVNGVKDYKCMEGYSDIVSGPDGVIDEITVALPHGTYCLEETEAPSGYIRRSEDVRFTISSAGGVTAASFLTKTDGDVCTYVLSIPNEPTETTHSFIIPTGIRTGHAAAATALLLLSAFGVLLMIHINKRERE